MEQTSLQPASCTVPGQSISTCTRCGYTERIELSPTGHDIDYMGTAGTCGEYELTVCLNCGEVGRVSRAGAGTHTWVGYGVCMYCGARKSGSGSYSLWDDLNKSNGTKYPDDMYPVIRIWP